MCTKHIKLGNTLEKVIGHEIKTFLKFLEKMGRSGDA